MNGVQTRFKCKLDVKRCKRFVFPPSSLLPRSNALKTKAIRYFQTDRTLTRIVSPPLCAFQDVMPTLAELAGITCPPTDGISFLPTLLGKKGKQKEHTYLYWEYPDPRIGNKAIRMGKWKGIITDIRKGNTQMQLYNLETDIREEHDVAAQHPDIVKRFERLMKEARNGPDF